MKLIHLLLCGSALLLNGCRVPKAVPVSSSTAQDKISLKQPPREIIKDGMGRICVDLDARLLPLDRKLIEDCPLDKLGWFHDGLGAFIRNHYGLWSGETPIGKAFHDLGVKSADYASSLILKEYWRHLHRVPSDIDNGISEAIANNKADRKQMEEEAKKEASKPQEPADPADPIAAAPQNIPTSKPN